MVLGAIELNHSGRDAGRTKVSNSYLCQVHVGLEYARDLMQSAIDVHKRSCDTCMKAIDDCIQYGYMADAFKQLVEYTIDGWENTND